MFVLVGICIGELDLIAAWAVLAPGNLVVRLPWSLLLATAMWYALVLGGKPWGTFGIDGSIALGCILLAGATIAQAPLWFAKRIFRWRLVRRDESVRVEQGPWQFTLRHLLLAMFLWAIALAPLRKVLPPGSISHLPLEPRQLVLLGAVVVCNLLVTVPCIWGALYVRTAVALVAIGWLFYCFLLTALEFFVLCVILRTPGNYAEGFRYFLLANLAQCVTVFGTLLIYRALGVRLVRAQPPARNTDGSTYP
jgi:hypothetical protein